MNRYVTGTVIKELRENIRYKKCSFLLQSPEGLFEEMI